MRIKVLAGFCAMTLTFFAVGCSSNQETTTNANNANANTSTTTVNTSTTTANTNTTTGEATPRTAPDGSEISVNRDANGVTTETRTFKNNSRISKVVVTNKNGKRTATVYSSTGEHKELPENKVADALKDTGDGIADAAGFVAGKTKDAAVATGKGIGKGVEKTGEGVKIGAEKTAEGAKKVGEKTVEGVKKTGEGAKKVGGAIKDAVTP